MTKTLSLWQPSASLIAIGAKPIETRSWSTSYRGRLAIHAAKRPPDAEPVGDWLPYKGHDGRWWIQHFANGVAGAPDEEELVFSAIVASCTLVDVVPIMTIADLIAQGIHERAVSVFGSSLRLFDRKGVETVITDQLPYGDFTPGRYAWLLEDVKPTTARCPACWGSRSYPPPTRQLCPTCDGKGTCDPVPAKGRQGLWTWAP